MKVLLIIIATLAVVVLLFKLFIQTGEQKSKDTSRPSDDLLPPAHKKNDKVIVVKGGNAEEVSEALIAFCNMYNKEDFAALPRLYDVSDETFAITFPFDTDFDTFCFAVNYLQYPIDIKWKVQVTGWATFTKSDLGIPSEAFDKKTMFYLSPNDKEYDNVLLTTSNNIGYKVSFTNVKAKSQSQPEVLYKEPGISFDQLKDLPYKDFK